MKTLISTCFFGLIGIALNANQNVRANSYNLIQNETNSSNPEGENICEGLKLPSLIFRGEEFNLSAENQKLLNQVAIEMRNNPSCRVVVVGHGNGNKFMQQLSWDRVNTSINFLVKNQQIDRERLIFRYGEAGEENLVDIRVAEENEEGSSNQPAPHPNLRR